MSWLRPLLTARIAPDPPDLCFFEPASHWIARIRLDDVVDLVTDGDQVVALGHSQMTWIDPSTNRVTGAGTCAQG